VVVVVVVLMVVSLLVFARVPVVLLTVAGHHGCVDGARIDRGERPVE
jgi:hypothetical protein